MSPKRQHKPNPAAMLMLAFLAFVSVYAVGKYVRGLIFGFPDPLAIHSPVPSATPSPVAQVSSAPAHASAVVKVNHETAWRDFSARFGEELKVERSADGHVAAIRGKPGSGEKAAGDFRPNDSDKALARAREVVDAAADLLAIEPGLPLGEPSVRTGAISAQVYFPETLGGLPLAPAGSVTVDLGPQGEILNLTSDYVRGVQVANVRSLSADQARAKAEAAVPASDASLATIGGNPVVWVTRTGEGGAPVGHQAYNFTVAGRQVVVDAGNGDVLFRRDRRQF